MNYYNDNDKHACAWLRELIAAKLIPEGEVDGRSITEIRAEDLSKYDQCHFFAGIGGWPYALSLAGWEGPCWTGSCPCQPFSVAGKAEGVGDERHLWPAFHRLIAKCHPPVVFGEQVASEAGRAWLSGVRADLEGLGYAVGAADLCAAGVGAPHIRQRLYWVGYAEKLGQQKYDVRQVDEESEQRCAHGGVAHSMPTGRPQGWTESGGGPAPDCGTNGGMAYPDGGNQGDGAVQRGGQHGQQPEDRGVGGLADSDRTGSPPESRNDGEVRGIQEEERQPELGWWRSSSRSLMCRDGKIRRIPLEPSLFPLAYGVSGRVGLLRGAGNSIVPQVAAEFVKAFME